MKNYIKSILPTVMCIVTLNTNAQVNQNPHSESTGLTIPKKFYKDTIDFSNVPKRITDKYPLSDQNNEGNWVLDKKASDEFNGKKVNENKWFPNNPKWKGRQPTFFAKRTQP